MWKPVHDLEYNKNIKTYLKFISRERRLVSYYLHIESNTNLAIILGVSINDTHVTPLVPIQSYYWGYTCDPTQSSD
jgi:hypothetical protein